MLEVLEIGRAWVSVYSVSRSHCRSSLVWAFLWNGKNLYSDCSLVPYKKLTVQFSKMADGRLSPETSCLFDCVLEMFVVSSGREEGPEVESSGIFCWFRMSERFSRCVSEVLL